jgi:hypothetical protein
MDIPFSLELVTAIWMICSALSFGFTISLAIAVFKEDLEECSVGAILVRTLLWILVVLIATIAGPIALGVINYLKLQE